MNKKIIITLILGTAREGRNSEKVFNFLYKILKEDDRVEVKLIDVKNYQIPFDGATATSINNAPNYSETIKNSQGLIFVFPEYNHSFPGQLKTLIDSEFDAYKGKTVALASVSAGQFGGARALTLFIPVVTYLEMVDNGNHMHFPYVENLFDEKGEIKDQATVDRTKKSLNKFINLTLKLNTL